MYRKWMVGLLCFLVIISLMGVSTPVGARQEAPQWNEVFNVWMQDPWIWGSLEEFKGDLYVTMSAIPGARVYRSPDGKTWNDITPAILTDNPYYIVSWDSVAYKEHLYVAVHDMWGYMGTAGSMILRTSNGLVWEPVFSKQLEDLDWGVIDKFGVFENMIYAVSVNPVKVWRSPSGDPGTWEEVVDLGPLWSASPLVPFKGNLYLSTHGEVDGTYGLHLWRSSDGVNWERVGQEDLSDPAIDADVNLAVFKGSLYLSANSFQSGVRVFRSRDGLDWEPAMAPGNGDPASAEIALVEYHGALFAPVYNLDCDCVKILRTETGVPGSWAEEAVIDGYHHPDFWPNEILRCSQAILNGKLYIATLVAIYERDLP
jgi:hypothetical protein